ncbi:hypothetical protein PGH47_43045 (plasmid) [Streptomyces sp. HUAS 31]|uniref:hypothetical protein n=1 Tax=Streptomyces sp. HUAS 31 TaxID=3020055 RepID=UPI0023069783|nr:hypothetical protein [Streptomyces sp. HUAS 31]WCE02524.1 hypothetical protein PGH47_43045 [Streptomyces sp. HUAS 31]
MNEQITRDGPRSTSAMLQMPQQAPPIDRTAATPGRADGNAPGVEADFLPLLPIVASAAGGLLGKLFG